MKKRLNRRTALRASVWKPLPVQPGEPAATMADADGKNDSELARTLPNGNIVILPEHPGPHPKTHLSSQWLEIAKSRLGGEQLLDVADGNPPARNRTIVDFDLSRSSPRTPAERSQL